MIEKSRVRALKQRIDDLPTGARRNHMQRAYACIDSMTRRLQNMHDGTASIEDMEGLKATVRHDAEAVAYLMLNVYAEVGGNPAMWMATGAWGIKMTTTLPAPASQPDLTLTAACFVGRHNDCPDVEANCCDCSCHTDGGE